MSPARRNRKRRSFSSNKKFPWLKIILFLVILSAVFFWWKKETRFWNGNDKLTLVINKSPKEVTVATFDPALDEITTISIPGETEVDVARGLGLWRLKSIWQLGIDEKAGGSLLAETITKNFDFPVFIWADSKGGGLLSDNAGSLFGAVFSPYKTNLGMVDKIKIALFSLGVKNIQKTTIDLTDTTFVRKTLLKDGGSGYEISGSIPTGIAATFSDKTASLNVRAEIIDGTGDLRVSQKVGEIIEVLGPKVALITKAKASLATCRVSGKYRDLTIKVARIFECEVSPGAGDKNFDLTVELGSDFPKKF